MKRRDFLVQSSVAGLVAAAYRPAWSIGPGASPRRRLSSHSRRPFEGKFPEMVL